MFRLCLLCLPILAFGYQDTKPTVPEETTAVDSLIEGLYKACTFEAGGEPDFEKLRAYCLDGVSFVQPVGSSGRAAKAIGLDPFLKLWERDIQRSRKTKTAFRESIVSVHKRGFGNLMHCYVVFEIRIGAKDSPARARGVDSIQLYKDRGRWWIASITTDFERPGKPIPAWLLAKESSGKKKG